jgi:N6-L-threonylcarbamoyladenine synthase
VHAKYGGVVPELASRAHIENLDGVIQEAMAKASVTREQLDAIAVTCRPGLMGCLLIGVTAAKTLSLAWEKPLIGVNHIHAHACSAAIEDHKSASDDRVGSALYPAVSLVVSGGHTSLYLVRNPLDIELLGSTIDDAAGEAFDKVASILNLGFPGGPVVDRIAKTGDTQRYSFPRTTLGKDSLDFSFSGIKTAVLYTVHGPGKTKGGLERLSQQDVADVTASFQAAVIDVLVEKTMLAARQKGVRTIMVGGGVAANSRLREQLAAACTAAGLSLHLTPMKYCTDNGAMIAALASYQFAAKQFSDLSLEPRASA